MRVRETEKLRGRSPVAVPIYNTTKDGKKAKAMKYVTRTHWPIYI